MRKIYNSITDVVSITTKRHIGFLILLGTILLLSSNNLVGQTTIPAGSDVYGTWDLASSPYLV
ncbi:MAG: hypothetical protein K8R58_04535 [Bacteroidales bacterium]|nr:hypothetical protein [Bacteroidales bacterium]